MDRRATDVPKPDADDHETMAVVRQHYPEFFNLFPDARYELNGDVIRFKENTATRFLYNASYQSGGPAMNEVLIGYQTTQTMSIEDVMRFYMDLGYSLDGFWTIFANEMEDMQKSGRQLYRGRRPVPTETACKSVNHGVYMKEERDVSTEQVEVLPLSHHKEHMKKFAVEEQEKVQRLANAGIKKINGMLKYSKEVQLVVSGAAVSHFIAEAFAKEGYKVTIIPTIEGDTVVVASPFSLKELRDEE